MHDAKMESNGAGIMGKSTSHPRAGSGATQKVPPVSQPTSTPQGPSPSNPKENNLKDGKYDQFIIEKVFPAPEEILATVHPTFAEIIESCLFVLDANTLLAPFLVGKDSLTDVARVFAKLVTANRLFIPAQAVREYARHRASKVAEAFGHVQQRLSEIPANPKSLEISMFEEVPEYRAASDSATRVREAIKEYKAKLQEFQEQVRKWNWNDPVTRLYSGLFSAKHIICSGKTPEQLSADLAYRVLHEIPPGFKDKSKLDGGIGDVAIWHSILTLGKLKNSNVIFVSNDGKTDWMVRSGDEPLYPRFELVDEFHRHVGKSFTIIRFTRFLDIMGAETTTVAEVAASAIPSSSGWGAMAAPIGDRPSDAETWGTAPGNLPIKAVLSELEEMVSSLLAGWDEGDEESHYIRSHSFSNLVDRFDELVMASVADMTASDRRTLRAIRAVLMKMDDINGFIGYQSVRMKRSTEDAEDDLRRLARRFERLVNELGW